MCLQDDYRRSYGQKVEPKDGNTFVGCVGLATLEGEPAIEI
jgi:hypothetical protein